MTASKELGIVIINYNGSELLEHCIQELLKVEYKDKEIVLLDNDSTDNSVELIKEKFPEIEIFETGHNGGYSGGAEVAVVMARRKGWDYLMLMNPDIIFEKDYLKILMGKIKAKPEAGAIIGKLRQYKFQDRIKTEIIDSAGVRIFKDRRVVDRGQGHKDKGQFDEEEQVFGITGAAPLYRMEALNDIEIMAEVFDTDFFMYKEDVDVSWRLNLRGWKNYYVPTAVAYHGRGTGVLQRDSYLQIAGKRKKLSQFQKIHSYRNQHFIQTKNDQWPNILKDLPWIAIKEILWLGYFIFEPYLFKACWQYIKKWPRMMRKRHRIMKNVKVSAKDMRLIMFS